MYIPCSKHRVGTGVQSRCTLVKKKHTEEESTSKLKLYCNQQPIRMYICIHESLTTVELQQDVWCGHVRAYVVAQCV